MANDLEIDYLDPETQSQVVRADGKHNCPNCGHCITGEKCTYCGTIFVDMACISMDEPFFMKIKHHDKIHIYKVCLTSASMTTENFGPTLYADDRPVLTLYSQETTIEMNFKVIREQKTPKG